jgi:hypothetical protein
MIHMKTLAIFVVAATISFASIQAHAGVKYSNQQCSSWFKTNDRNGDGSLGTKENASKFLSRVTLANDERGEYIMSKTFFMMECKIGSFGRPPV